MTLTREQIGRAVLALADHGVLPAPTGTIPDGSGIEPSDELLGVVAGIELGIAAAIGDTRSPHLAALKRLQTNPNDDAGRREVRAAAAENRLLLGQIRRATSGASALGPA